MNHTHTVHTVRDNSVHTRKDLEELVILLNKGCEVMMTLNGFNEKEDEIYFLLASHEIEDKEPKEKRLN